MKAFVRAIDALLRQSHGVYEFTADPACVLRIQRSTVPHDLHLDDQVVPAGAPALALHLWNDHVPTIPPEGPDVRWAISLIRVFRGSLHMVGDELRANPDLADVQAVGAVSTGVFGAEGYSGARVFQRLGFTVTPYHNPLGRFGSFWENVYSLWLMWAYNAASLRSRRLFQMERSAFWMTIEEYLARYGTGDKAP